MTDDVYSLITFVPVSDSFSMDCYIHPNARLRCWTMSNTVEVIRADGASVISLNGSIEGEDLAGNPHAGQTSLMYLRAAERQSLFVEYIEDVYREEGSHGASND